MQDLASTSSLLSSATTAKKQALVSSHATQVNDEEDFLHLKHYDRNLNILNDLYAEDWCYDKNLVILSEDMTMNDARQVAFGAIELCIVYIACATRRSSAF